MEIPLSVILKIGVYCDKTYRMNTPTPSVVDVSVARERQETYYSTAIATNSESFGLAPAPDDDTRHLNISLLDDTGRSPAFSALNDI